MLNSYLLNGILWTVIFVLKRVRSIVYTVWPSIAAAAATAATDTTKLGLRLMLVKHSVNKDPIWRRWELGPFYQHRSTWIGAWISNHIHCYMWDVMTLTHSRGTYSSAYSISQEICTRFSLCCALLWLYIDGFSHIHQAYFTGTVAI